MRHSGFRAVISPGVVPAACLLTLVCSTAWLADAQIVRAPARAVTVDALRAFPAFYHLQEVTLRGDLLASGRRLTLRGDTAEIGVLLGEGGAPDGPVEVTGEFVDVGRLDPGDTRAADAPGLLPGEPWPRPGAMLLVVAAHATEATLTGSPTIGGLALEPWRFEEQTVTVSGNFRGRNLFGDMPDAVGTGRYDFVLRVGPAAIWVTGARPRGSGFDLDVDRRLDTDRWLRVTGTVGRTRGMTTLAATQVALAEPATSASPRPLTPPPPRLPGEVVFSTPIDGEAAVPPASAVRVQFSRGLDDSSVAGHVRAAYADGARESLPVAVAYDAPSRSLTITFTPPLAPFRAVRVETTPGLLTFDRAPVAPWAITFSTGG